MFKAKRPKKHQQNRGFYALTLVLGAMSVSSGISVRAAAPATLVVSDRQKHMIQEITSVFENSEVGFQYAYLEDISDGAGVTAGRVGFNSYCGSLSQLVKAYVAEKPEGTPLSKYVPCLDQITNTHQYECLYPSLAKVAMDKDFFKKEHGGLSKKDFGKDWMVASRDPVMRKVQDRLVDEAIFEPARKAAESYGLKTAMGLAVIYDISIQQGPGLLGFIVPLTNAKFNPTHPELGSPANGVDEAEWLAEFLRWRRLTQQYGPSLEAIAAKVLTPYDTTERTDALKHILDSGDLNFEHTLSFHCYSEDFEIKD